MPAFNEAPSLEMVVRRVLERSEVGQLVVIDDASRDATQVILKNLAASDIRILMLRHERNQGKGTALRTGIAAANLPFVIIQDADLEYAPNE